MQWQFAVSDTQKVHLTWECSNWCHTQINTYNAAANSLTDICSVFAGGDGKPGWTGSIGFITAARPTDFVGDIPSVIDTAKRQL